MYPRILSAAALAAALLAAAPAEAQSDILLRLRSGSPLGDRFRVDSGGGVVGLGTLGVGIIPASGAGYRMMWYPAKAAFRAGSTDDGGAGSYWDDANIGYYSWAGGNLTTASGVSAFAFGYTARAGGQGSVALGYLVTANNDYSVALGYRASNNGRTGTLVLGDQSATDSVRNQNNNEFRARYNGGFRLRVSTSANGNTPGAGGNVGCDLTVATPTWTCASSRALKENFRAVDGEEVLSRLRGVPVTTWNMIGGDRRVRHLGPVAEDFWRAFGLGLGETAIGLGDIDGVNFAAAKALEARTAALRRELEEKSAEVEALRAQLAAVLQRLERLEAQSQQR
jgi:endosialidase-like protein/trimeric autotransporter adhesin